MVYSYLAPAISAAYMYSKRVKRNESRGLPYHREDGRFHTQQREMSLEHGQETLDTDMSNVKEYKDKRNIPVDKNYFDKAFSVMQLDTPSSVSNELHPEGLKPHFGSTRKVTLTDVGTLPGYLFKPPKATILAEEPHVVSNVNGMPDNTQYARDRAYDARKSASQVGGRNHYNPIDPKGESISNRAVLLQKPVDGFIKPRKVWFVEPKPNSEMLMPSSSRNVAGTMGPSRANLGLFKAPTNSDVRDWGRAPVGNTAPVLGPDSRSEFMALKKPIRDQPSCSSKGSDERKFSILSPLSWFGIAGNASGTYQNRDPSVNVKSKQMLDLSRFGMGGVGSGIYQSRDPANKVKGKYHLSMSHNGFAGTDTMGMGAYANMAVDPKITHRETLATQSNRLNNPLGYNPLLAPSASYNTDYSKMKSRLQHGYIDHVPTPMQNREGSIANAAYNSDWSMHTLRELTSVIDRTPNPSSSLGFSADVYRGDGARINSTDGRVSVNKMEKSFMDRMLSNPDNSGTSTRSDIGSKDYDKKKHVSEEISDRIDPAIFMVQRSNPFVVPTNV